MNTKILLNLPATRRNRRPVANTRHLTHYECLRSDERARQLADLASENEGDAAECAAADLSREFPGSRA
jgi:hypothetical protein